jgi:small subunit ribosomal protein S20
MPKHTKTLKRQRQNARHHERNQNRKSELKTLVRQVREAIAAGNVDDAKKLLPNAIKVIQKSASAGVVHTRNAARRISRIVKAVNKASSK